MIKTDNIVSYGTGHTVLSITGMRPMSEKVLELFKKKGGKNV